MNVNLGVQWEEFISMHVQSGRYLSASEVVRDGLRLLQEREQDRLLNMEHLREKIERGVADIERGDFIDVDSRGLKKHLDLVKHQGRQKLARKKVSAKS